MMLVAFGASVLSTAARRESTAATLPVKRGDHAERLIATKRRALAGYLPLCSGTR